MSSSQTQEPKIAEEVTATRDSTPSITFTAADFASSSAFRPPSVRPPSVSPFADPILPITPLSAGSPALTSRTSLAQAGDLRNRYFRSRRIKDASEVQKPWMDKADPREKWVTIIPLIAIFIGMAIAAYLVYDGIRGVINHKYCQVLNEDFSKGFRSEIWSHDVELGGFGNGQFEFATPYEENAYVGDDGRLHIQPTLTDPTLLENDNVFNLTAQGLCTNKLKKNCVTETALANRTIVNPVRSARIHTKNSVSIKYGRVEVRAKLSAGKWLWPAIWMLPVNNTYGEWPRSGEIDILESRGNGYMHKQGGNDIMSSALHWGPDASNNAWWKTNSKRRALHTTYSDKYHTFGLEWSENYLFTYVDSRLLQVLYIPFPEGGLYKDGGFPLANEKGVRMIDPWSQTGRRSTPFDQPFYLILNVAVGGTNGWFENGVDGKPWVDGSLTARKDFWDARNDWYPTWKNGGEMLVESVKMWQQCD